MRRRAVGVDTLAAARPTRAMPAWAFTSALSNLPVSKVSHRASGAKGSDPQPQILALDDWEAVSSPEKQDVDVDAQPDVIGQVPTHMVWVIVNHNLVRIPKPVITVVVVDWGNAEVEAAKPEAFPVSSC